MTELRRSVRRGAPGPGTPTTSSPSLRARLVRRGLATAQALRTSGAVLPDPQAPAEELERFARERREALDRLARLTPHVRGAEVVPVRAGVSALWVADVEGPADAVHAVLHVHGGAYTLCSPRTHRHLAAALSRVCRAPVLLPEYRLAPEHPFPAGLDDVRAAWRWLVEDRGVAPHRVALTGDSSGGGLGLALLVALRDAGEPLPGCYVGLSPWADLTGRGRSVVDRAEVDPLLAPLVPLYAPTARAYAGDAPLDHPLVSPLYADLTGLPPMLVHVGTDEILFDDARRLVDRAREAGVDASLGVFAGLWHVFHAFPGFPEGRRALDEIGGFVRRHIAPDERSWAA